MEGIKRMKNNINTYSKEHNLYLKKLNQKRVAIFTTQILILFLFLLLWEFLTYFNIVDSFLFSSPTRILKTTKNLYIDGELFIHIGTTLCETITGFVLASLTGIFIAIIFWWSDFLRKVFEPYVVVLNSLPKIALGPLIIIWFGAGTKAIIFMTFLVTVIVTVINMYAGFIEIEQDKINLLKSMGANKAKIFLYLVMPSSIPSLVSTLKINVGMSWIGSIMGEYLVSRQGIGYLIVYGGQVFKLDLVMTGTVILCLLAALMYFSVAAFEKRITRRQK